MACIRQLTFSHDISIHLFEELAAPLEVLAKDRIIDVRLSSVRLVSDLLASSDTRLNPHRNRLIKLAEIFATDESSLVRGFVSAFSAHPPRSASTAPSTNGRMSRLSLHHTDSGDDDTTLTEDLSASAILELDNSLLPNSPSPPSPGLHIPAESFLSLSPLEKPNELYRSHAHAL